MSFTIKVDHDSDTLDPCGSHGWKLYSFSPRHHNFKRPSDFGIDGVGRTGKVIISNLTIRRKVLAGSAAILSCYQHSDTVWSLRGEEPRCRFDTADIAGIIVWEGDSRRLVKKADRQDSIRNLLAAYNAWVNVELYKYIVCENGDEVAGCWGFHSFDEALKAAKDACSFSHLTKGA